MKIGSNAHRDLFCNHFIATFTPYEPEELPWPELDRKGLERLRSVPFWQEVLHTERRAGAIVGAFADTVVDSLVKEAVELQGYEETRHAGLLREMIRRYGISVEEFPLEPIGTDIETAFKDFGFGECLDSFLGFGAFKLARQSGFLPETMFKIFETLMFEETRHIVFFINWMAWCGVQEGKGWLRHPMSLRFYGRAINRLVGTVRRGQKVNDGVDFSATQASMFLEDFTFRKFLENCYGENCRRMSEFDAELLRPTFLPRLAEVALSSLRLWRFGPATKTAST
jgi:hypothetical protein